MHDKIKSALETIDSNVYYGVGRFQGRTEWDCLIFGRRRRRPSGSAGRSNRWFVAIVKEEYIPEGMEDAVIDAMKEISMRLATEDIQYDYVEKSGESIVEVCTMEFEKLEKACRR